MRYIVQMQTSGMHAPARWEAQDNWRGSTDSLDYAMHAMLTFLDKFAAGWKAQSVVTLDVQVIDTVTDKNGC